MEALDQLTVIKQVAIARRVLQQRAEEFTDIAQLAFIRHHHFDTQWLSASAQHVQRLRMAMGRGEEFLAALVLAQAFAEGHGFGGGGRFIQQRSIGDRQAGQVADQRLEVQQRLKTTLGNFWLVRRVSGVPGWVFQQVAQNWRRRVGVVVALADESLEQLVLARNGLDVGQCVSFALPGRQTQHAGALDGFGDDTGAQRFQRVETQDGEHGFFVVGARPDVTGDELVGGAQFDAISHYAFLRLRRWL